MGRTREEEIDIQHLLGTSCVPGLCQVLHVQNIIMPQYEVGCDIRILQTRKLKSSDVKSLS